VGGKIPCEIRRSKSLRPRSAPPSPSRILQIPAEIPQSSAGRRRRRRLPCDRPASPSQPLPRFPNPPEVFRLSPSLLLPPRIVATGPSSGTFSGLRGQGLPSAEIPSRREEAPPLSGRPRALLLVLEWRGGGDPPGRGSIPLRSVVFIIQGGRSIHKGARAVCFPKNSGGSTEPPCPTLSPPLVVVDWIGGRC